MKEKAVYPPHMAHIAFQVCDICSNVCGPDYKWSLSNLSGEAYAQAKRRCHARGADRLQKLCFANQGVYIKLGQHIAQLVCTAMSCTPVFSHIYKHLLDSSPPLLLLHRYAS